LRISIRSTYQGQQSCNDKEGRSLRVFTPFWRRMQAPGDPPKPMPTPKTLRPAPNLVSDTIESWRQEPAHPGCAGGLRETRQPSDISALKTRAQSLRQGPREMSTTRHPLYTSANPAIVAALTTLGDDMDDEKPVLEQMTDAMSSAAEATKEAAKTAVKKVRKAAKRVAKKVTPNKKAAKKSKTAKKAGKKSSKKSAKKSAKKAVKKTAKKKKKAKKSKR